MLIIKICLYTDGKEYVCPYTCEHYNMHTNLLNICKYENWKKLIVLGSILAITVKLDIFSCLLAMY